jgi:hypothetical protein
MVAGCGRIGFDPLDDGNGTGDDMADGEAGDEGAGGGGSATVDAGGGVGDASAHYITGGTASRVATVTSVSVMTGPLTDSNMVLVVAVHWGNTSTSNSTVQDSFGNGFSMAGALSRHNNTRSQVLWFKRITSGTTINVLFNQGAPDVDVKWAAYRDIDQASTIVTAAGDSGTSTMANSGAVTLGAKAIVVASSASQAASAAAGPGFSERHSSGGGVLEDLVAPPGAINATAMMPSSNDWIMQMVALRPN